MCAVDSATNQDQLFIREYLLSRIILESFYKDLNNEICYLAVVSNFSVAILIGDRLHKKLYFFKKVKINSSSHKMYVTGLRRSYL